MPRAARRRRYRRRRHERLYREAERNLIRALARTPSALEGAITESLFGPELFR